MHGMNIHNSEQTITQAQDQTSILVNGINLLAKACTTKSTNAPSITEYANIPLKNTFAISDAEPEAGTAPELLPKAEVLHPRPYRVRPAAFQVQRR